MARQATTIFEKALGRDNPRVAYGLTNVSTALVECLPSERAETHGFALGDSGHDPRRSRALVTAARADMVTAKSDNLVARIDRWLTARK